MGLCSPKTKPTQCQWRNFPGVNILPPAWWVTRAGPSTRAQPQPFWYQRLFCNNTRIFNKMTNGTLASLSLYFLTRVLIDWTPNLVILTTKSLTVFKSWPKYQTPFQNSRIGRFGRWHLYLLGCTTSSLGSRESIHHPWSKNVSRLIAPAGRVIGKQSSHELGRIPHQHFDSFWLE